MEREATALAQKELRNALLLGAGLAAGVAVAVKVFGASPKPRRPRVGPEGLDGRMVVILGAGFGGIHVAEELAKRLPPEDDCEIVLVDQNNFLTFTPLLTEAAGGQLDARDVVASVRRLSPRVRFEQGRVDAVDLKAKTVTLTLGGREAGVPEALRTLKAEHLVIALGSVTNFHDLPGVREHSLTIKTLADADAIRSRALALLERADAEPDEATRRALLTLVVGGGGFSGVETMAAVNDLLRDGVRRYPALKAEDVRAVLVQPGDRLLPELGGRLAAYAQRELEKRGVEVRLKTEISGAGDGFVEIKNGPRIPTHLLIWAGGVKPSPVISKLDCKRGHHGGIVVDGCCAVPDHPGVWALGDCAEVPEPDGKKTYAPTAQNAMREGTQAARNVVAALAGGQPEPFVYTPLGELAIVGKRAGVARVFGMQFSGLVAWAMWRVVYLLKMPGLSQRVRIALDWTLDMIFGRDVAALPAPRLGGE